MGASKTNRNGYIDIMKFLFALIITEFHLNTGIFPGGRIAVEGFFMISGYLMMCSIKRSEASNDPIGISTVKFIGKKYKGLFPYLFPAVLLAFSIDNIIYNRNLIQSIKRFPLLVFDIFPLREAGFQGDFIVGISWYLAAMFLSLAILYPLCKKYGANFVLTVCPIACLLIYGTLSHFYGNMAIATTWISGALLSSGLLRGFAGCAAGCILFEICSALKQKRVNKKGKLLFSIIEIFALIYLFYNMHYNPLSKFEFIMIFVVFGLLIIGIGELSYSSVCFNRRWIGFFGTASTLLVLSHYRLNVLFKHYYGVDYIHTYRIWIYVVCLILCCTIVWAFGMLIKMAMNRISKIKIWE